MCVATMPDCVILWILEVFCGRKASCTCVDCGGLPGTLNNALWVDAEHDKPG